MQKINYCVLYKVNLHLLTRMFVFVLEQQSVLVSAATLPSAGSVLVTKTMRPSEKKGPFVLFFSTL